jgi:hypothetical protein
LKEYIIKVEELMTKKEELVELIKRLKENSNTRERISNGRIDELKSYIERLKNKRS